MGLTPINGVGESAGDVNVVVSNGGENITTWSRHTGDGDDSDEPGTVGSFGNGYFPDSGLSLENEVGHVVTSNHEDVSSDRERGEVGSSVGPFPVTTPLVSLRVVHVNGLNSCVSNVDTADQPDLASDLNGGVAVPSSGSGSAAAVGVGVGIVGVAAVGNSGASVPIAVRGFSLVGGAACWRGGGLIRRYVVLYVHTNMRVSSVHYLSPPIK